MRNLVVDLGALRQNVRTLTAAMGDVPIYGVCKGNGFGMGLVPFAQTLLEEGIETLAVASIDDAAALRQAGISCDILMLSSTSLPAEVQRILELDLIASLGSVSAVELLEEAAEYRQTPCMEEMADLMEVIEAICKARSFDPAALQAVKQEKAAKRGAFEKRIFLHAVAEPDELLDR